MTKYTAQKDAMGCGVACVANRLGISYDAALRLFDTPAHAKIRGFKCKEIMCALRKAGVDARLRHVKVADRYNVAHGHIEMELGAIVLLEKSEMYPYQHYLLRGDEGWIDPWINMHENSDISKAICGIREILPGLPYYVIL